MFINLASYTKSSSFSIVLIHFFAITLSFGLSLNAVAQNSGKPDLNREKEKSVLDDINTLEEFTSNFDTLVKKVTAESEKSAELPKDSEVSQKMERLLTDHGLNPFTATISDLELEQSKKQAELDLMMDQLIQREDQLRAEFDKIGEHNITAESFLSEVNLMLEKLSKNTNDTEALAEQKRLIELTQKGSGVLRQFFSQYNYFTHDFLDLGMATVTQMVKSDIIARRKLGLKVADLEKHYLNMKKNSLTYIVNKPHFSGNKDIKRLGPNAKFFSIAQKYFAVQDKGPRAPFYNKMATLVKQIPKLLPFGVKILKGVYILVRNPAVRNNINPLTKVIADLSTLWAKAKNMSVKVIGKENIPERTGEKVRRIVIANHADGINDQIGLASLGIHSTGFIAAVYNFTGFLKEYPRTRQLVLDLANRSQGFIVAGFGRAKGTVERIRELIKLNPGLDIMYFPSGTLGDGFRFTNEARQNGSAVNGILDALMGDGYKLQIIPVAMPYNGRGHDEKTHIAKGTPSNDLLVEVKPTISSDVVQFLTQHGGPAGFGDYLRFGFFEVTREYPREGLLWSAVEARSMKDYLNRLFDIEKYNNHLNSCGPVLK